MFDIKENLKILPDKPGVYIHKDKFGQVIYVGKAVSLKKRVMQYFRNSKNMEPKVRAMVSNIAEFEYIITNSEMEALILENNLIKKYMPKYNVLLRDDKTFPYIKVTLNEPFPRVLKTRKVINDGARYFGPYTDANAVNQIIDLINDLFMLKRCSQTMFPEEFRPCLNYHIGKCSGACVGNISSKEYEMAITKATEFLSGKNKELVEELTEKMNQSAENLEYEKAADYRNYIFAINAISEKQRVVFLNLKDIDVILASKGKASSHIVVFFIRQGRLNGRESYHLQAQEQDGEKDIVSAFIRQYYSDNNFIPKEILVESEPSDGILIEKWLSEIRGSQVKIVVPEKGEKKEFLNMAKRDVIELSKTLDDRAKNQEEKKEKIRVAIEEFFPIIIDKKRNQNSEQKNNIRIEAYDISNTSGIDSVGAMVVFENGRPLRKAYRRFKIKTIEGSNDTGSMKEVLERRFKRGLTGDESFSHMPDLIFMDGGKPQISAAMEVLKELSLEIPVAGMVKDDSHRTRGLIYEGEEFDLKKNQALLRYVSEIQEEVHRFAIEYHRGLRQKKIQKSVLEEINGIGEKRRNSLLEHFGSIENIKKANFDELYAIPGMNKAAAEKVLEWSKK